MNIFRRAKDRLDDITYRRRFERNERKMRTYAENNPEKCCKYFYKQKLGRVLDLKHPKDLNEKIQYLKIHEILPNLPLYTQCADKYLARDFVAERGYENILIPLLGVYDSPDQIDFSGLPNQFVLKSNKSSGQNLIVKDKSTLDPEAIKTTLAKWLTTEYWLAGGEWQYRDIPPKIICEEYLAPENGELVDYKFFCYNGEVGYLDIWVDHGVGSRPLYIYLNKDLELVPFNEDTIAFQKAGRKVPLPENLTEMMQVASNLSRGFPFVRVDLYSNKGKIYFGELTFTPCAGVDPNFTSLGLLKLGEKIKITV